MWIITCISLPSVVFMVGKAISTLDSNQGTESSAILRTSECIQVCNWSDWDNKHTKNWQYNMGPLKSLRHLTHYLFKPFCRWGSLHHFDTGKPFLPSYLHLLLLPRPELKKPFSSVMSETSLRTLCKSTMYTCTTPEDTMTWTTENLHRYMAFIFSSSWTHVLCLNEIKPLQTVMTDP